VKAVQVVLKLKAVEIKACILVVILFKCIVKAVQFVVKVQAVKHSNVIVVLLFKCIKFVCVWQAVKMCDSATTTKFDNCDYENTEDEGIGGKFSELSQL